MNLFRLYLFAALAGCAIVSNDRVEGWPEMLIVEHRVGEIELRDRCDPNSTLLYVAMACATFDMEKRLCHIWLSKDFPPPQNVIEHETMHCKGYDHVGGSTMARIRDGKF